MEPADGGVPLRRAFLRVGGKTLARHQLEVALACGCERIVCICMALEPEVIELQHCAEAAKRQFNAIAGPGDLAGLLGAQDDVLVFFEGLMAPGREVAGLFEAGPAVLVQPVETGLESGFERLDLNHAAGGISLVPAGKMEAFFSLPRDSDIPSSLTRIALQQGVPMRDVPAPVRTGGRWQVIRSEADAYAAESAWLLVQLGSVRSDTPVRWLVHAGSRLFGSSLLHYGNASRVLGLTGAAMAVLGLAWAWLGAIVAGLVFCAGGWLSCEAATVLYRIEQSPAAREEVRSRGLSALGWAIDLAIVAIAAIGSAGEQAVSLFALVFPPLVMILAARTLPRVDGSWVADWLADRLVLVLLLAVAAAIGILPVAIEVLALVLMMTALAFTIDKRG